MAGELKNKHPVTKFLDRVQRFEQDVPEELPPELAALIPTIRKRQDRIDALLKKHKQYPETYKEKLLNEYDKLWNAWVMNWEKRFSKHPEVKAKVNKYLASLAKRLADRKILTAENPYVPF